jgi:hypothetical protein
MARIYLRLEVDFADDTDVSKLARYGKDARAARDLLVQMWLYCKRNTSDGHVPAEQVGKLVYPDPAKVGLRDAARLVEVGLAERTQDGFFMPGFLKHNKSAVQIEREREAKVEAGHIGGKASGVVRAVKADAKHSASAERSHSSEFREQSSKNNNNSLGGDRNETLHTTPATRPPCTAHPNGDTGTACGGCQRGRQWDEQQNRHTQEAAALARQNCTTCHGDIWLDNGTKCNHQPKETPVPVLDNPSGVLTSRDLW